MEPVTVEEIRKFPEKIKTFFWPKRLVSVLLLFSVFLSTKMEELWTRENEEREREVKLGKHALSAIRASWRSSHPSLRFT